MAEVTKKTSAIMQ